MKKLNKEPLQNFTPRQHMIAPDFEYFHYNDIPDLEVEYHNHDFYEIYFLISGKVTYVIEGRSYKLRPGDIVLIHSQELHRPVIEKGAEYQRIVVWVNPEFLKSRSRENTDLSACFGASSIKKHNILRPDAEMQTSFKTILARFERSIKSLSFGSSILRDVYLQELLVFLNRTVLSCEEEDVSMDMEYNEKVGAVIAYINENLGKELLLDDLSRKFYLSKYHLLREFKKHTGFTIHGYISRKRLILARELLRDGMTVAEASVQCGFGDYSNFIRAFKSLYGAPPRKYTRGGSQW